MGSDVSIRYRTPKEISTCNGENGEIYELKQRPIIKTILSWERKSFVANTDLRMSSALAPFLERSRAIEEGRHLHLDALEELEAQGVLKDSSPL